jgi:predicted transcriptional regulator
MQSEKKLIVQVKKYRGDSTVLSVRLPGDLIRELDRIAKETGRTRNELIQLSLEFSVENMVITNE